MAEPETLVPLLAALRALVDWLDTERIPGLVIGGVAASIMGRPRVTRDVDAVVLIDEPRWQDVLRSAKRYGLDARFPDALEFARRARVFLLVHRPTAIEVDVALGMLPFEEEAVAAARRHDVGGISVPLPAPEDLIIMKAVAHRPRDLVDIEAIRDATPSLDRRRISRWVRAFAEALERPEIQRDVEKILGRRRATSPPRRRPRRS